MKTQIGAKSVYLFISIAVFLTQTCSTLRPEKVEFKPSGWSLKRGNVYKFLNLAL